MKISLRGLCIALVLLSTPTVASLRAQSPFSSLNMLFTNDQSVSGYADSDVWITIARGQAAATPTTSNNVPTLDYVDNTGSNPFIWTAVSNIVTNTTIIGGVTNVTYTTNTGQTYSQSIQLSTIDANGGIQWQGNASAAQIVVSYGSALPTTNGYYANGALAPNNPSDPSYFTRYQNFELTYNPAPGNQGDITAINYFGSQLSISAFTNTTATGTALEKVAYTQPTSTLIKTLTNIVGAAAYGATTTSAIVVDSNTNIIRAIGPSTFIPGSSSYTNFNSYLGAIQQTNGQLSTVQVTNNSAYNSITGSLSGQTYTNASFSFSLTNAVTGNTSNGYGLQAIGTVFVSYQNYVNGAASGAPITTNYSNIQLIVSPNGPNGNSNSAATFIYGASLGNGAYISNTAEWTAFSNAMTGFKDGGGSNAIADISSQMAGELAESFAFGLAGSTNLVTNSLGTNAIGSLPSDVWWQGTNNVTPFAGAQTNSNFYDAYGAAIYYASSNSIYGLPYSDRFPGDSPLIDAYSTVDTNGQTNYIGSWLIGIGAPAGVSVVPEPSTLLYGLLSVAGLVLVVRFRRSRKD